MFGMRETRAALASDVNDTALTEYFASRQRLLTPPWDGKQLTIGEIRRAGQVLAGDPNDLRLFGMAPLAWYALGIRILGRTAVEVTRDRYARFMAKSVAHTLASEGYRISDVIDPFVGSGNLLYHLLRATKATRGYGLDINADIIALTERNFSRLRMLRKLRHTRLAFLRRDWSQSPSYIENRATLVVVCPPWGDAFDEAGLDLRKTRPPVPDVLRTLRGSVRSGPIFALIPTHPSMVRESVDAITREYIALPTIKSDDPAIFERIDYILLRL